MRRRRKSTCRSPRRAGSSAAISFDHACARSRPRGRLRRPRADDSSLRRIRPGHPGRPHRQKRRVRLRLFEARRDVRPSAAGCRPPSVPRRVTDAGTFDADVLVVALGADLDPAATPGLTEGGHEFYTIAGAFALRELLPTFEGGPAIVGVCGKSFKCPPAPSETALLLHDFLTDRGRRQASSISLVMPFGTPIPPSPDTSQAILKTFAERGITFVKDQLVKSLDPARKVAVLSDGAEMPYSLFLGIPVHRVPQVVVDSGLAAHPHDWVPVNKQTLATEFPGVYAIGDVNGVGTPKAGVFAEGSAKIVAAAIISQLQGGPSPDAYKGQGSCYVEFGHNQVGRVDVDFLSSPKPTGTFQEPSAALVAEKAQFGRSRIARWFGR